MDYFAARRFGTKLTNEILDGKKNPARSTWNGKPYRTKQQKTWARADAERCKDGAWRSSAPVSFHPMPRQSAS